MASVSHKKASRKGARDPSSHRQPGRPKTRRVLLKVPSPEPLVESEDDEDPLLGRRVTSEDENDAGVVREEDVGDIEAPQRSKGKAAHQNAQEVEGMSYTYIWMELLLHIVNRGGYRLHGRNLRYQW
jgi:hypothetical protein